MNDTPADIPRQLLDLEITVKEKSVSFKVDDDPARGAFFCLGVRKSGSTFLNHILNYLARVNGYNLVDLAGTLFQKGFILPDWAESNIDTLIRGGNLYGGFRTFPPALERNAMFRTSRKVFMFRDPRDALVSQYYSDAYSHSIPSKDAALGGGRELFLKKRADALASDINDYVLKHARSLNRTLERYALLLDDPTCLQLRYEEYVFQKRRLVHKTLKHFNWSCTERQVEHIMGNVDKYPAGEEQTSFVRKVIPGDHLNKLTPETIRTLNTIFSDVMSRFDYY